MHQKQRSLLLFSLQIENLQDQLRDKEKQLSGLKDRVKSLQTDTSNTDTALGTLEEALAEKVHVDTHTLINLRSTAVQGYINKTTMGETDDHPSDDHVTLPKWKLTNNHIDCLIVKSFTVCVLKPSSSHPRGLN